MVDAATPPAGPDVTEWVSDAVLRLFSEGPAETLRLPIEETPTPPEDPIEDWVNVMDYGAVNQYLGPDSSAAFQAAIDSGARTVYMPAGDFTISQPLELRGALQRLVAVGSTQLLVCNGATPGFTLVDDPAGPSEAFLDNLSIVTCDYEEALVNASSRALVVRHGTIGGVQTGSGPIFLHNVTTSGALVLTGQDVWARQLNPEPQGLHIQNGGGALWVLGLKTERGGVLVDALPGSATEILGGFVYTTTSPYGDPMFRVNDAELSVSIRETNFGGYAGAWNTVVEETQQGDTRLLLATDAPQPLFGSALPLYVSQRTDPPPPPPPPPVDTAETADTGATTVPAPPPEDPPVPSDPDEGVGCGCGVVDPRASGAALLLAAGLARARRRR